MGRSHGRPRKSGKRNKNGRLIHTGRFTEAPDHIAEKRKTWSFVNPTKGEDGKMGEVDQEIYDGIGMFHALGLLDNDVVDAKVLRDLGRDWRDLTVLLLGGLGMGAGGYGDHVQNKRDYNRTVVGADRLSDAGSARYEKLDQAVRGYERSCLQSLLIDPVVGSWPLGEENAPWVRAHIAKGLLQRGRIPAGVTRFPDCEDDAKLAATIRGLFAMYDAALPARWEERRVA